MRPRARVLLAVAAALLSAAAPSVGSLARSAVSAEGVSSLSYAPKPFYDDLSRMRVRFMTNGHARPGLEYRVVLLISGPDTSSLNCQSLAFSTLSDSVVGPVQRILGAPGKTYTVSLRAAGPLRKYFCHGRAELSVENRLNTAPLGERRPYVAHGEVQGPPRSVADR